MSTRRALGTGPDVTIPERDPRALTAAERAAVGDWVEEPERRPARPTTGRRPLGQGGQRGH
jgi:hypothetical protein